jgi:hypothetical protein
MTTKYNINRLTQTTDVLRVRRAATAICVRRSSAQQKAAPLVLTKEDVAGPAGVAALNEGAASSTDDLRTPTLFGEEDSVAFSSGWEMLMQQREVRNLLRSTREEPALMMRYPGPC